MTPPHTSGIRLRRLDSEGLKTVCAALALAAVFFYFDFLNFSLSYLVILVHEMGHTFFYWLFGYPSIPSFDLTYGGGITHFFSRNVFLLMAVFGLLFWIAYRVRRHPGILISAIAFISVYAALTFSHWHECIILAMGHGTELLFAVLCLYRMFAARGLIHDVERPLYGLLGFFIWFKGLGFGWLLMFSPAYRADYGDAKGGGHWMDFSQLADSFFHVPIQAVAFAFFVACLAVPIAAFLFFRFRNRILESLSVAWDAMLD